MNQLVTEAAAGRAARARRVIWWGKETGLDMLISPSQKRAGVKRERRDQKSFKGGNGQKRRDGGEGKAEQKKVASGVIGRSPRGPQGPRTVLGLPHQEVAAKPFCRTVFGTCIKGWRSHNQCLNMLYHFVKGVLAVFTCCDCGVGSKV